MEKNEPLKNKTFSYPALSHCKKLKKEILDGKPDLWINKDDTETAIRGFTDEMLWNWSIEDQDECSEAFELMVKWFPDIFHMNDKLNL